MKENILQQLDNPMVLENLYRSDAVAFEQAFRELGPHLEATSSQQLLISYWTARLNYQHPAVQWGTRQEILLILGLVLGAGLFVKASDFLSVDYDFFFLKNIGFFVLPFLMFFFLVKRTIAPPRGLLVLGLVILLGVFINYLPENIDSQTVYLSCIHAPLFLWSMLGVVFIGGIRNRNDGRLKFLRYNGELAVMSVVFLIAGFLMTALSISLFTLLDINVDSLLRNMVQFGLPAVPIVATYVIHSNPDLVNKVSAVVAKIFSPLVLILLVAYLGAMLYTGKDPYNNRLFLLTFNLMLIGVMALIFFSVAETSKTTAQAKSTFLTLLLSLVAIIVNGIALSAIVFRISEWGVSPNRLAVLGSNMLILVHLCGVAYQLVRSIQQQENLQKVTDTISRYLPIYTIWTAIVVILFPIIFQFR
ncbi:MAG: hypothetical protein AAF738_06510, partial [Bacteroidota bacterium]